MWMSRAAQSDARLRRRVRGRRRPCRPGTRASTALPATSRARSSAPSRWRGGWTPSSSPPRGPRPRGRLVPRDMEQHGGHRPDAGGAAHLVDQRAQPRPARGVTQVERRQHQPRQPSRIVQQFPVPLQQRNGGADLVRPAPSGEHLRHAGRHQPERAGPRRRHGGLQTGEPVGQRRGGAGVAEVVGGVHGVGEQDRRVIRRRRQLGGGEQDVERLAQRTGAGRDRRPQLEPRTRPEPTAAPAGPLAILQVEQLERAFAHPRRPRAFGGAQQPRPRTSSSGVRRADALEGPRCDRVGGAGHPRAPRPRRAGPRRRNRDARSPPRGARPGDPHRPPAVASAAARCAACRSCADAPEYAAERSSGCRNSTSPARTVTSPASSASPRRPTSSPSARHAAAMSVRVGAADRRHQQNRPALVSSRSRRRPNASTTARGTRSGSPVSALSTMSTVGGRGVPSARADSRRSRGAGGRTSSSETA